MAEGAEDADFQAAAGLPGGLDDPEPRDEATPRPPRGRLRPRTWHAFSPYTGTAPGRSATCP
eukprot:2475735-Lingulodinium_polyedra.AAC.1